MERIVSVKIKIIVMHTKEIVSKGPDAKNAEKALILLHGRGSTARNIMGLVPALEVEGFAVLAPQATNDTWYPYSFLMPPSQNEPWLSSALDTVSELTDEIIQAGIPAANIYFLGFSQGACLTLEFVSRHAQRYGGVVALTGGLIGDRIYQENYSGDYAGTKVFISSGNPDPHIPVDRITESVEILREMNADVLEKIYPNKPHMISKDEIEQANKWVFGS